MGHVSFCGGAVDLSVPGGFPADLRHATPQQIQAAARSGLAANVWAVGDTVPIELIGQFDWLYFCGTVYAFIIGFDHNPDIEGTNTIHFQLGKTADGTDIAFVNNQAGGGITMNDSATNSGGWKNSHMRTKLNVLFINLFPTAWQNIITACTKYTSNRGGGESVTGAAAVSSTKDKLWLLAVYEVYGTHLSNGNNFINEADITKQKQYEYYKAGNSTVKNRHYDIETACLWWLRTVHLGGLGQTGFCVVSTQDGAGYGVEDANVSCGLAPCFMVA